MHVGESARRRVALTGILTHRFVRNARHGIFERDESSVDSNHAAKEHNKSLHPSFLATSLWFGKPQIPFQLNQFVRVSYLSQITKQSVKRVRHRFGGMQDKT